METYQIINQLKSMDEHEAMLTNSINALLAANETTLYEDLTKDDADDFNMLWKLRSEVRGFKCRMAAIAGSFASYCTQELA
jgi:hypothetical protein